MKYTIVILLLFFSISAAALTSCGIKPDQVDPPQGEENDNFPRTYPDISTDPRP